MIKAIGFDATEDHRMKGGGTFAVKGDGTNICAVPGGGPHFRDRYDVRYYLREWGMNREACRQEIIEAGLPLPPKSACFFCPATPKMEIAMLRVDDPKLYELACIMERTFRGGHHFRGDQIWTITGKHKETGEKEIMEGVSAADAAEARGIFRSRMKDIVKPYRYKLSVSESVIGLGRHYRWEELLSK